MKDLFLAEEAGEENAHSRTLKKEMERTNARLRHFRGIAATVMGDAFQLWQEITEKLEDSRSCREILEGTGDVPGSLSPKDWQTILEKLQLLGIQIDYARRLCEGKIGDKLGDEGGF